MGNKRRRKPLTAQHSLWKQYGGRCYYCGKQVVAPHEFVRGQRTDPDAATLDHFIPKSKGGTDRLSNLVLACHACNSAKADTVPPAPTCYLCRRSMRHPYGLMTHLRTRHYFDPWKAR